MCSRDRDASVSVRDKLMSRRDRKAPSFSSTLLDDIYRSIDEGTTRKDCNVVVRRRMLLQEDEDEAAEFQRSMLLYKLKNATSEKMELDVDNKKKELDYIDNDPLFFSSGSNSSDSNSSLFSEHEPIAVKTRSSCFLPPKPIRTCKKTIQTEVDEVPASTKSRALKLYAHLKKMKQPISPGVKLTTFINSILSKTPKTKPKSTCSSARSCFNHQTTSFTSSSSSFSIGQLNNNTNIKPSVKFVDGKSVQIPTRTLKRDDGRAFSPKPSSKQVRRSNVARVSVDDAASDCSEDLFELDHLKLSGELPVYETTEVITNSSLSNRVAALKDSNL